MLVERWGKKKKALTEDHQLGVSLPLCVEDGVCVGRYVVSSQRINAQRKYMKPDVVLLKRYSCTPWIGNEEAVFKPLCWFKNRWLMIENPPGNAGTWVWSLGHWKIPLSETWETHSSILCLGKISWTQKPGWLLSSGLQRARLAAPHVRTHNTWQTKLFLY